MAAVLSLRGWSDPWTLKGTGSSQGPNQDSQRTATQQSCRLSGKKWYWEAMQESGSHQATLPLTVWLVRC